MQLELLQDSAFPSIRRQRVRSASTVSTSFSSALDRPQAVASNRERTGSAMRMAAKGCNNPAQRKAAFPQDQRRLSKPVWRGPPTNIGAPVLSSRLPRAAEAFVHKPHRGVVLAGHELGGELGLGNDVAR